MAESALCLHAGARIVSREALDAVEAPPSTASWFPLKHSLVVSTVEELLKEGGFEVRKAQFALSRGDGRLFATLDLSETLDKDGTVSLAVGIRNSIDKSLPLGFVAGSRVFVCDNLSFRAELLVRRKHTRNGQERFRSAICRAVGSLAQFRKAEADRIELFRNTDLPPDAADALILRAYEKEIVSPRLLPRVISEWRRPSFEEFQPRTLWSLFNAFTTILTDKKGDPQKFASLTMRLQDLLLPPLPSSEQIANGEVEVAQAA